MILLEERKEPQHHLKSEKFTEVKRLYLPLSQHTGKPSRPLVKPKDNVEKGDMLAINDGFISSSLHAPLKGKVYAIDIVNHPILKRAKGIILDREGESDIRYKERRDWRSWNKEQLLEMIRTAGIVGLGGACFPTYVKLTPPKPVDTLIINGCECEPYLSCDYRLMLEHYQEIFKGVEIISNILTPKTVIFALEDNKPEAVKKFNLLLSTKRFALPNPKIDVLPTRYPQGGEKQLIYKTTKRKVPSGGLPFDVGCVVHNVATAYAIFEAVVLGKPLIERLVTFAGSALKQPKNIWVKIGTLLKDLFDSKVLEFKVKPTKIICGGPMMGITLANLEYPIIKGNGGFLFLTDKETDLKEEYQCIRCARCVDVCPMSLLPLEYVKRVKTDNYDELENLFIKDCIECGCCSYICPAKIPIVHYIKLGKQMLSKKEKE